MGVLSSLGLKDKSTSEFQITWGLPEIEGSSSTELFFAPEWDPQSGVQLTWPHAATDWCDMLPEVTSCFLHIAREIAHRELLFIVAPDIEEVRNALKEADVKMENVRLLALPSNDTWARDHGALTLMGGARPVLLDFCFNGWGEKFGAEEDNRITRRAHRAASLHGQLEDHLDFILEGGSVETDGKGTILTTTHCLTAPHRNTGMSRAGIEDNMLKAFRAQRILWLDYGMLEGDDTDGHIDTLARMCPDDTIVYVQCTDASDSHFEELQKMETQLHSFRTSQGEPYRLLSLPMADAVYEDGERLPATYANYLIINGAVLYPTYASTEKDRQAAEILQKAFPWHEIIGIDCQALIRQHGSLHCVTMQYPEGVLL